MCWSFLHIFLLGNSYNQTDTHSVSITLSEEAVHPRISSSRSAFCQYSIEWADQGNSWIEQI